MASSGGRWELGGGGLAIKCRLGGKGLGKDGRVARSLASAEAVRNP